MPLAELVVPSLLIATGNQIATYVAIAQSFGSLHLLRSYRYPFYYRNSNNNLCIREVRLPLTASSWSVAVQAIKLLS